MADQNLKSERKLDPMEIVLSNVKILVSLPRAEREEIIQKQLDEIREEIISQDPKQENTLDFPKDPVRMLKVQIGLATLSTAIEYWMAKQRQGRIKVYAANEMPKA